MGGLILGFVLGGAVGMGIMCIMIASKEGVNVPVDVTCTDMGCGLRKRIS